MVIASVTNDFDGKSRPGANALYDRGADEFDGIAPVVNDIQATAFIDPLNGGIKATGVAFSPQASFTNNGTANQTSVTVRYRICSDMACSTVIYNNTQVIASIASGATTNVTFASTSIGTAGSYFIRARAELGTDTVPGNDEIMGTLVISGPLSGNYTVGTGGNYTSLTNAGGIFDALNNLGATSNITVNITSDLTGETGAVALNNLTGGYSVIITPTGAARTISGAAASTALIRLNGASNVTIDGSLGGGGTDRSLTITNTSTTSPQVVRFGSIGAAAITADTLRNTTIINGVNTSSAVLVVDNAGTAGTFNNITIQNNDIQRAFVGVFTNATVLAGNGSGLLITQNKLDNTATLAIRSTGIYVQGADGATVSNNMVGNFNGADAENDTGIWLATGAVNTTVSNNTVTNIAYTGTSANAPYGIRDSGGAASASGNSISGNTVSSITTTGGAGVFGIEDSSGGTLINRNNVQGVINSNTGTFSAYGINISAGNNVVVRNNFISNVTGDMTGGLAFSTTFGIFGLRVAAGTGHQIYNNSVNLYGARTGTATTGLLTAAFAIVGTTSTGMDVRNNVFANNITGGTTSDCECFGVSAIGRNIGDEL